MWRRPLAAWLVQSGPSSKFKMEALHPFFLQPVGVWECGCPVFTQLPSVVRQQRSRRFDLRFFVTKRVCVCVAASLCVARRGLKKVFTSAYHRHFTVSGYQITRPQRVQNSGKTSALEMCLPCSRVRNKRGVRDLKRTRLRCCHFFLLYKFLLKIDLNL